MYHTVTYLHARTVTSKHGTLRNNTRSCVFYMSCRAVPSRASLVAMQRCDKHISAATNQHSTVQKSVFGVSSADVTRQTVRRGHVMCLLFVGRCPTLGYISGVSSVPDEEDSVGIRGCEETGGCVNKTAYKAVTVQWTCSYKLLIVKKRVSCRSASVKRIFYV
jgi:hypothetical protein